MKGKLPANVVELGTITSHDLPPERILAKADEADLECVVVIGWKKETGDFYFAGSMANGPDTLWLLEIAKKHLLEIGDGDEEIDR